MCSYVYLCVVMCPCVYLCVGRVLSGWSACEGGSAVTMEDLDELTPGHVLYDARFVSIVGNTLQALFEGHCRLAYQVQSAVAASFFRHDAPEYICV